MHDFKIIQSWEFENLIKDNFPDYTHYNFVETEFPNSEINNQIGKPFLIEDYISIDEDEYEDYLNAILNNNILFYSSDIFLRYFVDNNILEKANYIILKY